MADLLTHLATVYVPTRLGVRDPAARSLVYLGVCLPDVISRTPGAFREAGSLSFHDIVHTPAFLTLTAILASQAFARGFRWQAFAALLSGGIAHLLLDAAKDSLGALGVLWGFPWTLRRGEWGLFVPDLTVYFMAPALLAIVLARSVGRIMDRRTVPPPSDGDGSPQVPVQAAR